MSEAKGIKGMGLDIAGSTQWAKMYFWNTGDLSIFWILNFRQRLWKVILKTLRRRFADIQSKVPAKLNPKADTAFCELMAYLYSLAHRKADDDKSAQTEN